VRLPRHPPAPLALSAQGDGPIGCITNRRNCLLFLLAEKTKMSLHISIAEADTLRQNFKTAEEMLFPARVAHDPLPAQSAVEKVTPIARNAASPAPTATRIELREISHIFKTPEGGSVYAVDRINLSVPEGRFASIIGPSGCGKTTLFNIIAGLETPTGGEVLVDGQNVSGMIGIVGYMLQKDLLFPWRTVLDNICLGMELRGLPMREARERAMPYLERYGLGGFENQYPAALSGGMKQRAALLRTLLYDSDIVLLDEPFGALDAQTKSLMQNWLLQLWSDFRKTVLFVTHDLDEALFLSDEIFVLSARPGRIKAQIDVPLPRPRTRDVFASPVFLDLKHHCLELLFDSESQEH
jgi:ABC-type nitrate/sulfonate/bicarbonate transport system ATPase subunit